jgi:hypothetical protein
MRVDGRLYTCTDEEFFELKPHVKEFYIQGPNSRTSVPKEYVFTEENKPVYKTPEPIATGGIVCEGDF